MSFGGCYNLEPPHQLELNQSYHSCGNWQKIHKTQVDPGDIACVLFSWQRSREGLAAAGPVGTTHWMYTGYEYVTCMYIHIHITHIQIHTRLWIIYDYTVLTHISVHIYIIYIYIIHYVVYMYIIYIMLYIYYIVYIYTLYYMYIFYIILYIWYLILYI